MEVGVERTDSQRLQANGPRVSFNRDVHVKRIGKRPNETENYPIQTTNLQPPQTYQLRRELPKDRSEESILKEAALVLAQAERIKCKAEGGSDIVGGRLNEKTRGKIQRPNIPNKFHSLPSRKKNSKPITRSVSDASSKKSKKPSIFSIFRKSDTQLDQIEPDRRFKEGGGRRLIRSKSDASPSRSRKFPLKKNSSENEETVSSPKSTQLSPIIENTQKEDYFEGILEHPTDQTDGTEIKGRQKKEHENIKEQTASKSSEKPLVGNIGFTSNEDLDLIPSKPVADAIKETVATLATHSKSPEDMHSSQLPPEKPPLTKGLTVDGMVKRLSMERFSPPPPISGPAFSYTRPNEQIIYAQVVCDSEGRPKDEFLRSSRESREMDPTYKYQTNGFEHRSAIERSKFASQNKTEVYINDKYESQYRPYSPPTVTRNRLSSSPQHWKHSPRNLSDEDEGLGFEPRKYFEEDLPTLPTKRYYGSAEYERKSPSVEPPIIPVIRSVSPIELETGNNYRGKADGMDSRRKEPFSEFSNLSYRREALESKIRSRRFGSSDQFDGRQPDIKYRYSPDRSREFKREFGEKSDLRERYISPDRDTKFHKLDSKEVVDRYSPDRTHLDMVSPSKDLKTSRYVHTKVYDDGSGGVKETYEREMRVDEHGKPHTRESRRRERFDSPKRSKEYDGYRDGHIEDKYRQEYEPKSLDSQFSETNRSSPDNLKRIEVTARKHEEHWHEGLQRDKRQQRSFDKGDSGIENDFRKESFNGELTSKWRKRTVHDDIKACEQFIKNERRHTEELHPQRKKYDFVYRERSIDDGSHFDPRLDKYPKGTLRKKENTTRQSSPNKEVAAVETLKREKKVGGFERVKKLFSSGRKKENKQVNGKQEPGKDRYMVKEEEMRSRYHEYRGVAANLREPNVPDISTRRRLSTPKASPLLKRTSSQKTSKPSPLSLRNEEESSKAEKSGWFKSLDRKTKKKYSEKLESPFRTPATTEDEFSTLRSKKSYRTPIAPPLPEKNLRFFGDTDQESNPSFSKAAANSRTRPSVATLNRNQKYSQSAYNLDRISKQNANRTAPRSNSLQNLEDGLDETDRPRRRHHSRSRELDDISESASDAEDRNEKRHSSTPKLPSRDSAEANHSRHRYEEHSVRRSDDRDSRTPQRESSDTTRIEFRKPPPGPPKPARSSERSHNYSSLSRERDRLHDSSGTEGESSLPSQRSVVYLHATTVGAIPQPYQLNSRRRAVSREELRSKNKSQPMTRTVSRSVSMLAPWKPKHLHDGYEINYSQETPDKYNKMSTMPRKSPNNGSNSKMRKTDTISRSRKNIPSKDDMSSVRNSSTTSASKSGTSTSHRTPEKRSGDLRKDTLSRRRVK